MIVRKTNEPRVQGYTMSTYGNKLPSKITVKFYDFDEELEVKDLEALVNKEWVPLAETECLL